MSAERPILFSGPMVRAILDGTKTMTRRIVEPQPNGDGLSIDSEPIEYGRAWRGSDGSIRSCPYGVPGDRLWVRETHAPRYFDDGRPAFRADWTGESADLVKEPRWTPAIHMRRAFSRIDLEVTAVRVERLQDITEEDARAEGVTRENVPAMLHGDPALARQAAIAIYGEEAVSRSTVDRRVWPIARNDRDLFMLAWTAINSKRAPWASNPWVWCVSFKRVRP